MNIARKRTFTTSVRNPGGIPDVSSAAKFPDHFLVASNFIKNFPPSDSLNCVSSNGGSLEMRFSLIVPSLPTWDDHCVFLGTVVCKNGNRSVCVQMPSTSGWTLSELSDRLLALIELCQTVFLVHTMFICVPKNPLEQPNLTRSLCFIGFESIKCTTHSVDDKFLVLETSF